MTEPTPVEETAVETDAPSRKRKILATTATVGTTIALTVAANVLTSVLSSKIETAILKPKKTN
jgi:hypothetical protein